MWFKKQQRPEPQEPPLTEEDIRVATQLYSERWHYFDKFEGLPEHEKEFLKEIARAELLKKLARYAQS